jgi:superfamily II DNA/RNA helicase
VQVDAMMGAAKEGGHLQKLLSVHTHPEQRQTILASATIPQHRRFLQDCVQNKWTKVV